MQKHRNNTMTITCTRSHWILHMKIFLFRILCWYKHAPYIYENSVATNTRSISSHRVAFKRVASDVNPYTRTINTCYLVLSANIQKVWNDNDACNAHTKKKQQQKKRIHSTVPMFTGSFHILKDWLSLSRCMCYYASFEYACECIFLHVFVRSIIKISTLQQTFILFCKLSGNRRAIVKWLLGALTHADYHNRRLFSTYGYRKNGGCERNYCSDLNKLLMWMIKVCCTNIPVILVF